MAFFALAYDTTAAQGIITTKSVGAIQQALLRNNFALANNRDPAINMPIPEDGAVPTVLSTRTADEMSVPIFSHPLLVSLAEVRKSDSETYLVSDARSFMPTKLTNDGIIIKNSSEFEFTKYRTIFSSHWYKKHTDSFKHLSPILPAIYASWVSEAITRRFGLDARDQMYLNILAAYLYCSFFYEYSEFDSKDRDRLAASIARATRVDAQEVYSVLEAHPQMANIDDFCHYARVITENPRLDELSPALVVTMIANTWLGLNAREIAAVALEHVPTFIMMVYSCYANRFYRISQLSKICDRYKGSKGEDGFMLSLKTLAAQLKTTL